MDNKPRPVHYETTWKKEQTAPRLPRIHSTAPAGSIVRLVLGTITTVAAVYAIIYALMILTIGSIGAAFGGEDVSGVELVVVTGLMLAGGIVMLNTRWSKSGGIVAGVVLLTATVMGMVAEDSTDMAPVLAIICCIVGVVSIFVSCIWGGTGSRI